MKRTRLTVARALPWLLAAVIWAPQTVVSGVEQNVVFDSVAEATQAARYQIFSISVLSDQLRNVGNAMEVADRFARFLQAENRNPAGAELSMLALADRLGQGDPNDTSGQLVLQWLAAYSSRVLVPHSEGRGQTLTAAFPIASRAQGALNQLEFRRQYQAAQKGLAAEQIPAAIQRFDTLTPAGREGLMTAFYDAPVAQIRALASQLNHNTPQAVAVVLARRLSELVWYDRALSGGDTALHFELMRDIESSLPENERMLLLQKALATNAAAAAVTAMGRLVKEPAVRTRLLSLLGDDALGDAAALALSKSHDRETLEYLDKVLRSVGNQRQRGHALLALKLNGSEVARSMLSDYVSRAPADDPQARLVKKWQR